MKKILAFILVATIIILGSSYFLSDERDLLNVSDPTTSLVLGSLSPLFSVCMDGLQKQLASNNEFDQAMLPFHATPLFREISFGILLVLLFKDTIGGLFFPLKKSLDSLDVIQNKIMSLICLFVFLPAAAEAVAVPVGHGLHVAVNAVLPVQTAYAAASAPANDIIDVIAKGLSYVMGMAAFYAVWCASHVVNILALIAPIPFIGVFLKTLRLALLGFLMALWRISPFWAFVFSLITIYFGFRIAGWASRLTIFGCVAAFDVLGRRWRRSLKNSSFPAFTGSNMAKLPKRVFGALDYEDGMFVFRHRPWLLLKKRTTRIECDKERHSICEGLICPSLDVTNGNVTRMLFLFPPRFRTREEFLARHFEIKLTEGYLVNRLRFAKKWLCSVFSQESTTHAA